MGSFKNTKLRHCTVRTLKSLTQHLRNFLPSLNNTIGTLMTDPSKTIMKSTPMFSAISLKNTSTRNRWEHTTPKRTLRNTSARIPLFHFFLMQQRNHVKSHLKVTLPFGNSYKKTLISISTRQSKKALNYLYQRKLLSELTISPNVTNVVGTHSRPKNMPYRQKFGGRWSHAGNVMNLSTLNLQTEK